VLGGVYRAPDGATGARLELHLRWTARGEVLWRGAALRESDPPAPRRVRLAAVNHRPYIVASGYDFRTGIFDRRGQRIADAREDPEVVIAEIDLAERTLWPWLRDWRSRIWREAPAWAGEP
jgi:predicted amidohydrolase